MPNARLLIKEIKTLSADHIAKTLDFVEFLKQQEAVVRAENLSGQFAGSLHLSDDKYEKYQNTLREGRYEWDRNIF